MHRDLRNRGGRVVAISIDSDRANAMRFIRQRKLGLPLVHDGPDGLARAMDLDRVPYTVVLDRDGRVAFTTSESGDKAMVEIRRTVDRLLAQPARDTQASGEDGR
jgi:peroxiredoxin